MTSALKALIMMEIILIILTSLTIIYQKTIHSFTHLI